MAVAAVGLGTAAVAGVAIRHHVREGALQKKHGEDYVPKKAKYHHYTNNNAARRIAKTRNFKPTGKHAGHGHKEGVWLTRHHKKGHYDGMTRDVFGKARVTVKLSRREVLAAKTHSIHGGLDKSNKHISHIQVHKTALHGKRMKHNLPKTRSGTRRRAHANRGHAGNHMRSYTISRDMAVSPLRSRIKRKGRRRRG